MNGRFFKLMLGILLAAPLAAADATVWYVDFRQTQNPQTGQSWNNAFDDVQSALLNGSLAAGDTVRVAIGEYRPAPVGQPGVSFVLRNAVAVEGGYNGLSDPQNPDGRVIDPTLTVLSGDLADNDVDTNPDLLQLERSENSLVVVHAGTQQAPVGQLTVLDNFAIRDGHHFNPGGVSAGIYIPAGSNPTITNCIIKRNAVPDDSLGGGVYVITGGPSGQNITQFTNCTIEDNEGGQGAGLAVINSRVILEACIIRNNHMTGQELAPSHNLGAGFLLTNDSDGTFIGCQVLGNTWSTNLADVEIRADGGGGAVAGGSRLYMKHCLVADNHLNTTANFYAMCTGGGISGGNLTLVDTVFDGNIVEGKPGYGAGVYAAPVDETPSKIINCTFKYNRAGTDVGNAVYGGGIYADVDSVSELTNVLMHSNYADLDGGGLYLEANLTITPSITNCTIANNHAGRDAGGVYMDTFNATQPIVNNSIFWGNTDDGFFTGTIWEEQLWASDASDPPLVAYSCIADDDPGDAFIAYSDAQNSQQNIDEDPIFYDVSGEDYRLRPCSPAIDVADETVTPADSEDVDESGTSTEKTPDLDLVTRVIDIDDYGNDVDVIVDMGSYEYRAGYHGDVLLGDMNRDGLVNGADVPAFTKCAIGFGNNGPPIIDGCLPADMDQDGDIDFEIPGVPDDKDCFVMVLLGMGGCQGVCSGGGGGLLMGGEGMMAHSGSGAWSDCNGNGIEDAQDLTVPFLDSLDCNDNGIIDACDIASGYSQDANANGYPDECDAAVGLLATDDPLAEYAAMEPAIRAELESQLSEWAITRTWGPSAGYSGSEQFELIVEKRRELGLPLLNRWVIELP